MRSCLNSRFIMSSGTRHKHTEKWQRLCIYLSREMVNTKQTIWNEINKNKWINKPRKSLAFGLALVNMFITWPASIAVLSATFGEYAMQAIDPWVCVNSDSDKKAVQLLIAICFTCMELFELNSKNLYELFSVLITYLNFGQLNKSLAIFQNITTLCKIVTSLVICGAGGYYYFFKSKITKMK